MTRCYPVTYELGTGLSVLAVRYWLDSEEKNPKIILKCHYAGTRKRHQKVVVGPHALTSRDSVDVYWLQFATRQGLE